MQSTIRMRSQDIRNYILNLAEKCYKLIFTIGAKILILVQHRPDPIRSKTCY